MTDFNRAAFFDAVRASGLCGKSLTPTVVQGLDGILDAWGKYSPGADLRHVAYTMATGWHEARLDMDIREIGRGAGHPYGKPAGPYNLVYYGRGPSQLTWYDNYVKFGKLLGIDLARFPDKALEPMTGAAVLILGSRDGLFRKGQTLAKYFNAKVEDAAGARDIINGDVAKNGERIAAYYRVFLVALRKGGAVGPVASGGLTPASKVDAIQPQVSAGSASNAAPANANQPKIPAKVAHTLGAGIHDALSGVHDAIHDALAAKAA